MNIVTEWYDTKTFLTNLREEGTFCEVDKGLVKGSELESCLCHLTTYETGKSFNLSWLPSPLCVTFKSFSTLNLTSYKLTSF